MPDIYMDVNKPLAEIPINKVALIDDSDFKTRETGVLFGAAGMDLEWNFITTTGGYTQTAVTPTSAGDYDWLHQGGGLYSIEMTSSTGTSANNNVEGVGWFTGFVTGVLPFAGPTIGFRAAGINDKLIDSAYSTGEGLSGDNLDATVSSRSTHTSTDVREEMDANSTRLSAIAGQTTTIAADTTAILANTTNIQDRLPTALTTDSFMRSDAVAISGSSTSADDLEANIGNLDDAITSRSSDNAGEVRAEMDANSTRLSAIAGQTTAIAADTTATLANTTDIQDRIPASLTTDSFMRSDAVAISGSSTSANELEANIANLDATVSSRSTDTSTDVREEMDANSAGLFAIATDTTALLAESTAILANTTDIQDSLTAAQTDLDTLTDAAGEPGDIAPPVSLSLTDKVGYLYKFARNKIETESTAIHVYNDAGANKDQTAVLTATTSLFTREEFGAGDV
ncbi:MAG TPA: hypothetical protein ENI05_13000 [Porticoccus sp.]|nr:hypothetical protein [Porticoccus sp.]